LNSGKVSIRFPFFISFWLVLFGLLFGFCIEAQAKRKKRKWGNSKATQTIRTKQKPKIIPIENPESPEFQNFIKKINEIKKGKNEKARILILGDSHMQCEDFGAAFAGFLSDSLSIPMAGRGFAFPYPLARTSHRSDLWFGPNTGWHGCRFTKNGNQCDWGMAGWTAHLDKDSADFAWKMADRNFEEGDELLLFAPEHCAYTHRVIMFDSTGNQQILFYNQRKSAFHGKILKTSPKIFFQVERQEAGKEFVIQGFLIHPEKAGLVFGISGTNGARLDHYLQNPDFQKHLSEINPDLVVISLGTNDAFSHPFDKKEIRSFLTLLLARVKAASPNAAILLVGPPDHCLRKRKINPKTELVNEVFSQTADELDFIFWNQQKSMGGKGSIFYWRQQKWATTDLVHFTQPGYRKQAYLLFQALKPHFASKP
jgi:lysophospholipase L1-like esterase